MKTIVYNHNNLSESEIDEVVIRVKALIINSKNEILLGYCHETYQFPDGHVEENESLEKALKREVKEETGIEIKTKDLMPFEKITYYSYNYRNTSKNRKNEIYYYSIKTDEPINMSNANLDNWEKEGNYIVKTIPITEIEEVLVNSISDNPINKIIVEEMLEVIDEYKKNN